MALYYFICNICGKQHKKLSTSSEVVVLCCGQKTVRDPQGVSSRSIETIDNGLMTRKVERLTDITRFREERSINKRKDEDQNIKIK